LPYVQLEQFLESFTLLDDAWRDCKDTVSSTGILAIMIWVVGSTMFWLTERHEDPYRYGRGGNAVYSPQAGWLRGCLSYGVCVAPGAFPAQAPHVDISR
jgi:hypothetical protein